MAVILGAVVIGALVTGAVRGDRTAAALRGHRPVHDAQVDDAYYRCLDVQTQSLVSPEDPVFLPDGNIAAYVSLMKAAGSWLSFADGPGPGVTLLTLEAHPGPGGCLGQVVVATRRLADGQRETRQGRGASVPGSGPPPAPPL